MGLFTPDLFRSLAAGFVLGAAALVAVLGGGQDGTVAGNVLPPAVAAPVSN